MTYQIREIPYSVSTVGNDPKNPLNDIHKDDLKWLKEDFLIGSLGIMSSKNQKCDRKKNGKNDVWVIVQSRSPDYYAGQDGLNSTFSFIAGLLDNLVKNERKYGAVRISKKQMRDIQTASHVMNSIDNSIPPISFRKNLFSVDGGDDF
jgi:uncharacterized protein with von Willebrand factor type A (vWA) domain